MKGKFPIRTASILKHAKLDRSTQFKEEITRMGLMGESVAIEGGVGHGPSLQVGGSGVRVARAPGRSPKELVLGAHRATVDKFDLRNTATQ